MVNAIFTWLAYVTDCRNVAYKKKLLKVTPLLRIY